MHPRRLRWLGLTMVAAATTLAGISHAASQTFNTALPVAEGSLVLREQLLYLKASDDNASDEPGPAERNLDVFGSFSVLGYGVRSDLALFGVLPYLDKQLELTTPGGERITRSAHGIGDAQVFAPYTLLQHDRRGSTFRVAPFVGIKLPTGDDNDRDGFGRLPQPLQPGSGSWDLFGGVIATYQTLDYQLDTQISYKTNTEANGFEFGDESRLDASAWTARPGASSAAPAAARVNSARPAGSRSATTTRFTSPTSTAIASRHCSPMARSSASGDKRGGPGTRPATSTTRPMSRATGPATSTSPMATATRSRYSAPTGHPCANGAVRSRAAPTARSTAGSRR